MRSPLVLLVLTLPACMAPIVSDTDTGGDTPGTDAPHIDAPDDGGPPRDAPTSSVADDEPYSLVGSGFGENAYDDQLWMGGRTGSIESEAVGHDITTDPRWDSDTRGSSVTQITDVDAWSHDHAIAADASTSSFTWPGIFDASYDTGVHMTRTLVHWMVRWDDLGAVPLENMQWKMLRLCYAARVVDDAYPNVLLSNWIGQATWGRHGGDDVTSWLEPADLPRPDGAWYAVELEVVVNAPLSASNGSFHLRVRRTTDGRILANERLEGIQYIAPGDPNGFYQWIVFQNYQGNLMDGSDVEPTDNPSRVLMDDVYALTGGAGRYVVLADAARWADVTAEEIQPIESWSDGEIRISHLNLGRLDATGPLYLYVKTSPSTVTREEGYPLGT